MSVREELTAEKQCHERYCRSGRIVERLLMGLLGGLAGGRFARSGENTCDQGDGQ